MQKLLVKKPAAELLPEVDPYTGEDMFEMAFVWTWHS